MPTDSIEKVYKIYGKSPIFDINKLHKDISGIEYIDNQDLMKKLGVIELKLDDLNLKLDRIFGKGAFINGKFIELKGI